MKSKILAVSLVVLVLGSVAMAHADHEEHEESEIQDNSTAEEDSQVQRIKDQYPGWTIYAAMVFLGLTTLVIIVGLNMYWDEKEN